MNALLAIKTLLTSYLSLILLDVKYRDVVVQKNTEDMMREQQTTFKENGYENKSFA